MISEAFCNLCEGKNEAHTSLNNPEVNVHSSQVLGSHSTESDNIEASVSTVHLVIKLLMLPYRIISNNWATAILRNLLVTLADVLTHIFSDNDQILVKGHSEF